MVKCACPDATTGEDPIAEEDPVGEDEAVSTPMLAQSGKVSSVFGRLKKAYVAQYTVYVEEHHHILP